MEATKKKNTLAKRIGLGILSVFGIAIVGGGAFVSWFFLNSFTYQTPATEPTIANATGLVQQGSTPATARSIYDADGNKLILKGVNVGQILLQESWMSPFALGPKTNPDGSVAKDKDGNVVYPEFTEEDFRNGIEQNPNLKDKEDELLRTYYQSFFSADDFKIVKNELKMNAIRLPFYWRNIMDEDEQGQFSRKDETEAFSYLDWFVNEAKANGLYVILDLHGVPGSQNGYEHSGLFLPQGTFWDNLAYQDCAVDIWSYVSYHYTVTRPDLAPAIAAYDLLNEPQEIKDKSEGKQGFDIQNRMYKAIRANNDQHLITIESMWDFSVSPDPKAYGWTNIMYQYHHYNWLRPLVNGTLFKSYHDSKLPGHDFDVPVYIGEFTCFEDQKLWHDTLVDWYDKRGYSWTLWNYKLAVIGDWTSSWGVYTAKMKLTGDQFKPDVRTCTEAEFLKACDQVKTQNCATGVLADVIQQYNTGNWAYQQAKKA